MSLAYSDALITAGVKASIVTVGDSCDNAFTETAIGLFKAELIHRERTWPTVTEVENATLDRVHWWITKRLHEALGYRTSAEVEAVYTPPMTTAPAPVSPRNGTQVASDLDLYTKKGPYAMFNYAGDLLTTISIANVPEGVRR